MFSGERAIAFARNGAVLHLASEHVPHDHRRRKRSNMMSSAAIRHDRRTIRPALGVMDRHSASGGVRLSRMIALLVVTAAISGASIAAGRCDAVADFYRGRSISLVIGFGAGGGYDAYARLLARHIGRHIPGNPSLVAQNMQGAGGLKATQFLYDVAPRDGTVIGTVARGQPLAPLLLGNTSFDATRFTWIGSVTDEASLCLSWFTSKARTWRDLMTAETLFAGEGQGADPDMFATALNRVFGAKIKLITGFHSTREMTLAMQRGEVEGICGVSATTLLGQYADWIAGKQVNLLAQMALRKDDRFPDVPLVTELAQSEEQRQIIRMIVAGQAIARPFFGPPGIPEDRKQALRAAFDRTMQDPEFRAEAQRAKMDVNPMQGAEMESFLRELYAMPKDVVDKAALAIRK
jgi:tripartite-type tricarboxylate transporter receptor subunit TctC